MLPKGSPKVVRVPYRAYRTEPVRLGSRKIIEARKVSPQRRFTVSTPQGRKPFVKTRVLLLVERPTVLQRQAAYVELRNGTLTKKIGRTPEVVSSSLPTDRTDRKRKGQSGGHSASLSSDRRGIVGVNSTSALLMDLASGYVQGRRVRK